MQITERYASAIRSTNLKHDDRSIDADTDVLGAFGLADRALKKGQMWSSDGAVLIDIPKAPLAVPLERLFSGDKGAAREVVKVLSDALRGKAPAMHLKMTESQCTDMAKACLAWHRDSVCKLCGGQGMGTIKPHGWVGGAICKPCKGTGNIPFEDQFRHDQREIARWLVSEMAREQCRAGPAALKALAPRLDF